MAEQTVGEKRVRIDYNPTGNPLIDEFKQKTAYLIDLCNSNLITMPVPDADVNRRLNLAMDNYELACMWAVEGVETKPGPATKPA